MKKCFKCGIEKELFEFYAHPQMGDGHLNKCKECTKNDVHKDYQKNIVNPEWHQKEKNRGQQKYHRLNYRGKNKPSYESKKATMDLHKNKYPEKYAAKCASGHIKAPDRLEKHHWSYNKEHYKDVFFLSKKDHNTIHRFMIYDQERMMYRALSGELLDSRELHETYISQYIK
jgi:hypothetical protein